MNALNKTGKFYTQIIMKHIGIFIFVGILFVVFHDQGWFPNENIYAISQLVYHIVLPALIAFEGGRKTGETNGGILAVLAVSGVLIAENSIGILGAMLLGPAAGFLWKYEEKMIESHAGSEFQMLLKNLTLGITGGILAAASCYLVNPVLVAVTEVISRLVNLLIAYQAIGLLSVVIEPLKVFFLNNVVNHAVLVPVGMEQIQEAGSSVLFLLETNPGPGLGVLAALCCMKKESRNEYVSAMIAEAVGGIHEVYFPFIWADFRLLIPLILGGMAGNLCFSFLHAGLRGVVSPGSILVIFLMAGKGMFLPVLAGIFVSVLVSFVVSIGILRWKKGEEKEEKKEVEAEPKKIDKVAFVCDGGVGSSAMGAAIFRKMLEHKEIEGISVKAYAADLVPEDIDVIVCQKDFFTLLSKELKRRDIYKVESLVRSEEYERLAEQIQRRNEGIR